ncbi:MAG: class I SAM-dependent methyltransferase [Candidatus Poribacteria bacterium]|nr:class I SAM-dependent methyltransferase [Candidatus Poribacteria bacterium]
MHQPQTWHYGLIARWWMEFNDETPELDHLKKIISHYGEPVLDVACGTGRVSLPLLATGVDVDATDISGDMLDGYRTLATRRNLTPSLYQTAMHELDLPRQYRTIFICGGFGLGGSREQDVQTLRRCHDLLEPGGALVFDHEIPFSREPNRNVWNMWADRPETGQPFPESGTRRQTSDGTDLEIIWRLVDFDPLDQLQTHQLRARHWRGDELLAEQDHTLQMHWYLMGEISLMMRLAGFGDISVCDGWTDNPPVPYEHGNTLLFIGRKATR